MEHLPNWATIAAIVSTIVSIIALLRTFNWRKPKIYLHDLKGLIVGFTRLGPLFTFRGTLESRNKDSLVSHIKTIITRKRDKAEHVFTWHSWEQPVLSKEPQPLILASAFLLAEQQTVNAFLTLQDEETLRQFEGTLIQLRTKFEHYITDNNLQSSTRTDTNEMLNVYDDFSTSEKGSGQSNLPLEVYNLLQRLMYWEAGEYSATIEVHTAHPNSVQKFEFEFSLEETDYQNLKSNLVSIMWDSCSIPNINYNTARPTVKSFIRV